MRINEMRTRVLFQKAVVTADEYDNRVSTWANHFRCWATVLSASGSETDGEASTQAEDTVNVTVRCCSEVRAVKTQGFRIVIDGLAYDIEHIDRMADKGNALKFRARAERRHEQ